MTNFRPITRFAAAALLALPSLAMADTEDAGAYLAARQADIAGDYEQATRYYAKALAADQKDGSLMEATISTNIALGTPDRALAIAKLLAEKAPDNQIANMVLIESAAKAGDYDAILKIIDAGNGVGPLVDGLVGAWAEAGLGQMSEAIERFDKVSEQAGLAAFGLYHKALALSSVGDFESAAAIFAGEAGGALPPTRRGIVAYAEVLSQIDKQQDAIKLIDDIFGAQLDPGLASMRAALERGEALPRTSVRSVTDGIAEVFYSVAVALTGESADGYTLLYARIAEDLRPDHSDAHLLAAQILERMDQYDLAIKAFDAVGRDDAAYYAAESGRADALRRSGRTDAALEVMQQLAKSHPEVPEVFVTLGDMQRSDENYADAAKSYTSALAAFDGREDSSQWIIYYARGISYERLKRWDEAEPDFRKALELSPDQPNVLNYLGYSFLEKHENLDEALKMIETAVAARPDDGYITDSLGWGFYLLGRYDEAVVQMERAVELMPVDAVVNDHLGDVYWAVGRQREAQFQWRRALSFDPEPDTAARIRSKLELGLDTVLANEGAPPLKMADGG